MGANKPGKEVHDQHGRAVGDRGGSVPAVILVNPQLGENIGSAARKKMKIKNRLKMNLRLNPMDSKSV